MCDFFVNPNIVCINYIYNQIIDSIMFLFTNRNTIMQKINSFSK